MKYNCEKTEDFLHEYQRMCGIYGQKDCESCPLYDAEDLSCMMSSQEICDVIEKVQEWSDENPLPSRIEKFMELIKGTPFEKAFYGRTDDIPKTREDIDFWPGPYELGGTHGAESQTTQVTKQKEEPKKRTPIDTGKVMALVNAGWSKPKIADEMGVSVATIYNVINRVNKDERTD